MSDPILSLSTELEPAPQFEVDGELYELLGLEHLSDEQEAEATALFTRFQRLSVQLDRATNDRDAKRLSTHLRTRRLQLIEKLTTLPKDVVAKLPLSAQIKLFRAVSQTFSGEEDDGADLEQG